MLTRFLNPRARNGDARIILELFYNSGHVRKANEGPLGCVRAAQGRIYFSVEALLEIASRGRECRLNATARAVIPSRPTLT